MRKCFLAILIVCVLYPALALSQPGAEVQLPYPESFYTEVNGLRVHGRRLGDFAGGATPILLVHGLGGHSAVWDGIAYALAETYPILLVDLKGFGYTDAPLDGSYRITGQAKLLRNWLDTIGVDRVTLVGQSMGAYTAHWFAMQHPERLASVLLLAGAVVADPPARTALQDWVISFATNHNLQKFVDMIFGRWTIIQMYNKTVVDQSLLTAARMDKIYAPYRLQGKTHALLTALYQLMYDRPAELDNPQQLQVPAMMGWGDSDRVAPAIIGEQARAFDPGIQFVEITKAGHNTMWDQPQQVIDLIERTHRMGQ